MEGISFDYESSDLVMEDRKEEKEELGEDDIVLSSEDEEDGNPDEDPIVQEIPVYLSNALAKNLYLFQYPVRSLPWTKENGPVAARLKPVSQLIELDIPIDTRADTYNRDRGEELAVGVSNEQIKTAFDTKGGQNASTSRTQEPKMLDLQTLSSSLVENQTSYMIGVTKQGAIHLNPVQGGTVQLRPSFHYLDRIDEKQKAASRKVHDEENKEDVQRKQQEQELKAKAIQVQIRNKEDPAAAKQLSHTHLQRQADEETWTKLAYYDETTEEAEIIYEKMFAYSTDQLEVKTTATEYIDMLSKIGEEDGTLAPAR